MSASMLAPATLYGAHDAISTSSSTLVNTELEERQKLSSHRQRQQPPPRESGRVDLRSSYSSSSASTLKPRRNAHAEAAASRREPSSMSAAAAWTKDRSAESSSRRSARAPIYPDDHRCSDQEIDGGLCSCMRAIASGSNTSDNSGDAEVESDQHDDVQLIDQSSSYHRRLMSARKRKVILDYEHADQSNKENSPEPSRVHAASDGTPLSTSLLDIRQRRSDRRQTVSDPVEVSSEDDGRHGGNGYAYARPPFVPRRATSPSRTPVPMQSSPIRRDRQRTETHLPHAMSASKPPAPSAARKSISNMYERLLREEEKRREEERERKEAARQRRRNEKSRRAEDSQLFARLTSSVSTPNIIETSFDRGDPSRETSEQSEPPAPPPEDSSEMPPYTSPILAVSPPSTRDATVVLADDRHGRSALMRTSSHDRLHPLDAAAISSSPNAKRLADLRDVEEEHSEISAVVSPLGSAWSQAESQGEREGDDQERSSSPSSRQRRQRVLSGGKASSPRVPSPTPSSTDSVLNFAFPNRLSPSTSPNLQAVQAMSSPQQTSSSPRRSGHRRGADREGASQMLSMSARVPAADGAVVAARVENTLQSPLLSTYAEREGDEEPTAAPSTRSSLGLPFGPTSASTSTETRRVKFSPKPEIISTFFDIQEEDDGEEEEVEEGQDDEEKHDAQRGLHNIDNVMSVAFNDTPLPVVRANDQIDLDEALGGIDDGSRLSVNTGRTPLRGSPMKRTFASPRFPGSYFSPLGAGKGVGIAVQNQSTSSGIEAAHGRASSPPLKGGAPALHLSEHKGPARSRSWNANLSLAETSSGSSADMPVVEEKDVLEDEEDADQVTEEGSSFRHGAAAAAPQQSTPPRRRATGAPTQEKAAQRPEDHEGVSTNAGDDSMHITLERLNRLLDLPADEVKADSAGPSAERSTGVHDSKRLLIAAQEVEAGLVKQSRDDTLLDEEEYIRRVEAARDRLTSIVKTIRSRPADSTTISTIIYEPPPTPLPQQRMPWVMLLCALSAAQFALVWFMIAAAHARSEHMYLMLHYGGSGSGAFAIPPRSLGSLLGPILSKWGIVPDVGQLASGERERMTASWMSLVPWALSSLRRRDGIVTAVRTLLAKVAYSIGLYTLQVVPVGMLMPS